jgi:hypothetical protein
VGKEESSLPYQRRSRGAIASTREGASKGPGAGPNSNLSAILKKAHQRGVAKSQRVSGTGHGYHALANMESVDKIPRRRRRRLWIKPLNRALRGFYDRFKQEPLPERLRSIAEGQYTNQQRGGKPENQQF